MIIIEIIRLTNSKNLDSFDDYKELIEKKRKFLRRNQSQNSNIIEKNEDEKNKNKKKSEDDKID